MTPLDSPAPSSTGPQFPDVTVQLTGQDGNVFAIIGAVSRALKQAGQREAANVFTQAAFACDSYDAVLALCLRTVDVH